MRPVINIINLKCSSHRFRQAYKDWVHKVNVIWGCGTPAEDWPSKINQHSQSFLLLLDIMI